MRMILLLIGLAFNSIGLISQSTLQGTVLDFGTKEPVVFANVSLYQSGGLILDSTTDMQGFYSLTEIDPGEYEVLIQSIGYNECLFHGLRITSGNTSLLNGELWPGTGLERFDIFLPEASPLFQQFGNTSGSYLTSRKISKIPLR